MRPPCRLIEAMLAVVVVGMASVSSAQPAASSADDRLVGVWLLNVARSTYSPGPAPTSESRTYVREADGGLQGTILRMFADGRRERIEYSANFDREYPVVGTEAYDHVILKRVDEDTAEAVLSHAGRVFGTARRVISIDGRSMTISFKTENDSGTSVHNEAYYEKVVPSEGDPRP